MFIACKEMRRRKRVSNKNNRKAEGFQQQIPMYIIHFFSVDILFYSLILRRPCVYLHTRRRYPQASSEFDATKVDTWVFVFRIINFGRLITTGVQY